jgi:TrwC relaxase
VIWSDGTSPTSCSRQTHDREPRDDAELKAFFTRVAKPPRQPVAGVDLVFTPGKSVSVLWALGDDRVRREVERAHQAAWRRRPDAPSVHRSTPGTDELGLWRVTLQLLRADRKDLVCAKKKRNRRTQNQEGPGLRWPVERTDTWMSNFGQLGRNTDRSSL